MSVPILVDRFVANGAAWIDLATGGAVRIRSVSFGDRHAQFAWADTCATHARLRHPMLLPLLDYGALDRSRAFEAYGVLPPLRPSGAGAHRLLTHAMQFLQTHGVDLGPEQAAFARRDLSGAVATRVKPLGIVLQERPALRAIDEVLTPAGPGGAASVTVSGSPSSGLRTLRLQAARAARLRGYVAVTPGVLADRRWLIEFLAERHVCVFADDEDCRERQSHLTALLTMLGRASTRRHVVIVFTRSQALGPGVIPLRPMGVRAMASMVFGNAGEPSARDLFDAARGADGKPGRLLDRLGTHAFEPHVPRVLIAHETAPQYGIEPPTRSPARDGQSRTGGVLARAAARAEALAKHGRNAAAARLLSRAARVLAARGDGEAAARCELRLGRLHLSRGRVAAAIAAFERARTTCQEAEIVRTAALGLAVAWTEDGRLHEAEALLRSIATAESLEQRATAAVVHALALCLYWQGRYVESGAALHPHLGGAPDARCLAMAARVQLAEGSVVAALQRARRATEIVTGSTGVEAFCEAERTLAAVLAAAGDLAGARQRVTLALQAARDGRRPMDAIRARIVQLGVLANANPGAPTVRRLADRLVAMAGRLDLPRLVRYELRKTVEDVVGTPPDAAVLAVEQQGARWPGGGQQHAAGAPRLSELETFMEACHTAADDREALDRLCAAALERLRAVAIVVVCGREHRVRGHGGRAWDGQSQAVERALTGGIAPAFADAVDESPLEAAEAVKFGGEVIGAVACRWIAGTPLCPDRSAATLKATALAAAAPLRAVLDTTVAPTADPAWPDLLGSSPDAMALRDAIMRAARAPYPVLIEGESGSGKELVARAVHRLGPRRDRRFCAINCAALTDELLEAELFGHTRGAFTGAVTERSGLFEEADGGTLFLDEIGELSPRAQAKLLRVIQEGEIRRVGESFPRKVDVRIVAATNRRLEAEAAAGRFRTDLRFRLDVIRITVPPLRERAADIPLLASHFWNDAARRVGSRATLAPGALAALARYDWPGNVRELQNVIAWLAVHSPRRGRIGAEALPRAIAGLAADRPVTFERAREDFERRLIRSALAHANGHRARAAASLGVTRQGLAKMMRRLRIDDRPAM
jgi:DNA-binding NtrC family response regulator/tetratricopeptide (TPR) repeat protein